MHIDESGKNRKYQSAPYQNTVFKSYKEEQYRHDSENGNDQIKYKSVIGDSRFITLIIDCQQFEAIGHLHVRTLHCLFHKSSHIHHITV